MLGNSSSQVASSDYCLRLGAGKRINADRCLVLLDGLLDSVIDAATSVNTKARIFLAIILMMLSLPTFALGVGEAEAKSFIGQQLSVRIPLFNVSAPNSLQIDFDSTQFGGNGQANVTAELDRTKSQLAIKLSSDTVVNEPYLNFSLSLLDSDARFSRDFTVLLNLPPQIRYNGSTPSAEIPENGLSSNFKNNSSVLDPSRSEVSSIAPKAAPGSTMGPYETAVAGSIPERFGAVLDGQSLWRVARRIDSAMGVTRDQMMWALYQANPKSFSSERIESLKAGAYLTIPSASIVRNTSDSEAKAKLLALSQGKLSANNDEIPAARELELSSSNEPNVGLTSTLSNPDDVSSETNSKVASGSFQVTPISQSAGDKSSLGQTQMIVASLTETVGNMSQQLERKDRKIEFLEAQVQELKSFISTEEFGGFETKIAIVEEPISSSVIISELPSEADSEQQSQEMQGWLKSLLPWGVLALIALCVVIYAAWERIQNFFYKLNLFGRQDDMEFSTAEPQINSASDARPNEFSSSNEAAMSYRVPSLAEKTSFDAEDLFSEGSISVYGSSSRNGEDGFNEEPSISFDGGYEEGESGLETADLKVPSIDSANTIEIAPSPDDKTNGESIRVVKHDLPEGVLDANYDESEIVQTIEFLADEITARKNDEGLTFEQRFDSLLQEKDFDFARELLDFARYNEINDDRYHFERLRMLEKMGDDDAFYEYYYSIEDEISEFPQQIQTQISQLVVQIALT